ncbi:putative membrane associated protein, partial [Trypanosoma theileri]
QREAEERAREEALQRQREAEERAREEALQRQRESEGLGVQVAEHGVLGISRSGVMDMECNEAASGLDEVGSSLVHAHASSANPGMDGNSSYPEGVEDSAHVSLLLEKDEVHSSSYSGINNSPRSYGSGEDYETTSDVSLASSIVIGQTQNDNGILGNDLINAVEVYPDEDPEHEMFETHTLAELRRLGLSETDVSSRRIECHEYVTIREPGRCLYPPGEEREGDLSAVSMQLGFFRAKQFIITSFLSRLKRIAERELDEGGVRRRLSTMHCFFESELLNDPSVTFDDDDLPHNAPSECMMPHYELLTETANTTVSKAVNRVSFGDPIQVWERARGHSFDLIKGMKDNAQGKQTYTRGPTASNIWSGDVDTKKPTTSAKVFSGGVPLRVECTKIAGPMINIHGNDVDPLIFALYFCNISSNSSMKVSETFYFGSAVDIFYPHKERRELCRENRVVTFIPQDFLGSLYLVVRVYRPASEDFENYVDLYTRPDRYKSQHVIPMKQETQLLAMSSDALEELGWGAIRCWQERKPTETIELKRLYRKAVDDTQLYQLVNDERSRNALRTVPFELEFSLSDCTTYEVAFPTEFSEPRPEENETVVSLLNSDVPGARAETYRYAPCSIPILNSGFFHAYHNVYYFRINKVKIANTGVLRKVPNTHRTFVMQLCVKDQDVSLSEEGLPLIYGRSLSGKTLETSAWTSTVHNCADFELSDEFKIQLPLYLTDSHHIFITLYASYQKKNPPSAGQQRLYKVGYAAFPICRNGVVQVKQDWSINFVSVDQAVVIAAGGYLTKFPEAPSAALVNNGSPVLRASTQTRTSVHASNNIIAGVLKHIPAALVSVSQNDDVLASSGNIGEVGEINDDSTHLKIVDLMQRLPLAEILAFYPLLSSFNLAIISSPSKRVSLDCRTAALDVFIDIMFKAQQYDLASRAAKRKKEQGSNTYAKTSAAIYLYHYFTNDVLYSGKRYRVYAGVAETWLNLLKKSKENATENPVDAPAGESKGKQTARNIKKQMADLSWFLFDVILRSLYLWALDRPKIHRNQLFHPSFYTILGDLCVTFLSVLHGFAVDGGLVQRVALFVRNLFNYCDRGQVLLIYQRVVEHLAEMGDMDGTCVFLRITLEDPEVVNLMLPSPFYTKPVFLTRILVDVLSSLLVHKDRDTRASAIDVLYSFFCGITNNPHIPAVTLKYVASQFFVLIRSLSSNWKTYLQLYTKLDSAVAVGDKRQLVVTMLWIIYYTPRRLIQHWLVNESESKVLVGFLNIISDAQSLLRYNNGTDKASLHASPSQAIELREWDARMSTFVTAIGSRMCSIILQDIPHSLQSLRKEKANVVVFPFFVMLESLVHMGNSTIALQFGSSAMFEVVCTLFPEIMSRTARMSTGMVLLVFRLMSTCCQYVRYISGQSFFLMCQSYFTWTNSLSRMKSLTANALVSVAESKARNLRLAGRFIEFQFDDLMERARKEEERFVPPTPDYNNRYESDANQVGGNSGEAYKYHIKPAFLSVQRRIPISKYLLEKGKQNNTENWNGSMSTLGVERTEGMGPPRFSQEFAGMSESTLSLFRDVLRLQMDDSMRFKEAKVFAYFEVLRNFLRQNALREVLKWLHRLYETHKNNGNMTEAGMVFFFIGALCFRVTEVFYYVKGKTSNGARMPFALLDYVFWQDYVRVLPEVDVLLPADTVYAIVSELYICPDDPCFTVEGQVKTLKEAAEHLEKEQYYEFAVATMAIVDKYLRAVSDFNRAAVVHLSMAKWCTSIARYEKRENHRYFLLWARMEREERPKTRREMQEGETLLPEQPRGLPGGRAIKRVYKMPFATTQEEFAEYSKAFITSLFEDANLVVATSALADTLPAIPEPTSKKKRVAALHQAPNHCLLTVFEVQPTVEKGEAPPHDGFDKTVHISKFQNVYHNYEKREADENAAMDIMNQRMVINTYELDRAFPSTTSAIDVSKTESMFLDPYDTAKEILSRSIEKIEQAPEDDSLIVELRESLSPMQIKPPGAYMKEVIATMVTNVPVMNTIKRLSSLVRTKLSICEKQDVITKHPEDYALVLKAVTDIECCVIASEDIKTSEA